MRVHILKLLLFILGFSCSLNTACAKKYFFSATAGDDTRTPTQAQSTATPWRSIDKLNTIFKLLQPGDSILFKRGDVFYGTIRITVSGKPGKNIVLAAYGEGKKPVISSLVTLNKWVETGNGIWESYNNALGATVNMFLLDGAVQELGRFPNSNRSDRGYLTIDSHTRNQSITDSDLASSPNWAGAEIVIRKNRWTIDRNIINSHKGGTINYNSSTNYNARKGFGYFIQNHIRTLDRQGEWYYDPGKKKLYVYFGRRPPSSLVAHATTSDNVLYAVDANYILFTDLSFSGGNTDTFRVSKGSNITVDKCNVIYSGRNGINVTGHPYFTIKNSSVYYSNSIGIRVTNSSSNPFLQYNTVQYTGLFPGMGNASGDNGIGIQCFSKRSTIEYNTILNSGYNGLAIKLNETTVKNNFISDFCSVTDDGGGIYSHNKSNKEHTGARITGNIVKNGIGAPHGTGTERYHAEGIYMDDNSNNVNILNNTVINCHRGVFLHNARNIRVEGNTFYDNRIQFSAKHDNNGNPIRGLYIYKNILFSKMPDQIVAVFESSKNDIAEMGLFDNNHYERLADNEKIIYTLYRNEAGKKVKEWLSLDEWVLLYNKDLNSKEPTIQYSTYVLQNIIGSNRVMNSDFSENRNKIYPVKCTLNWVNEKRLDGVCLRVTPATTSSFITMGVGRVSRDKKYLLKYSVVGDSPTTIGVYLRRSNKPYRTITPVFYRKVSIKPKNYEIVFSPSEDQDLGTLVFAVESETPYFLDNILFFEAEIEVTKTDDLILFKYNPSNRPKKVEINGNYIDLKGNKVKNIFELAPYSSVLLRRIIATRAYND